MVAHDPEAVTVTAAPLRPQSGRRGLSVSEGATHQDGGSITSMRGFMSITGCLAAGPGCNDVCDGCCRRGALKTRSPSGACWAASADALLHAGLERDRADQHALDLVAGQPASDAVRKSARALRTGLNPSSRPGIHGHGDCDYESGQTPLD